MVDRKVLIILFLVSLCFGSVYAPDMLDYIEKEKKIDDLRDMITNDTLKEELRFDGYTKKDNKELSDKKKYISYNSSDKELHLENHKFDSLIKIKLLSDYTTYVYAGEDVKVAEFLLI
ncbi:MAG: hypothetical protein KAS32_09355, partial [Candidatus Peribacteraceae bacterium]|nr:hypothetical protein [Candidatus Peribacteraceae bacterium]